LLRFSAIYGHFTTTLIKLLREHALKLLSPLTRSTFSVQIEPKYCFTAGFHLDPPGSLSTALPDPIVLKRGGLEIKGEEKEQERKRRGMRRGTEVYRV